MVGKVLSHYRILEELGRGGMGIVYKAEDTRLDRIVAIKVLPASALASQEDRARFYREAKAAARLHHPHIAAVFEIDQAVVEGTSSEEPRPFIAMEFVDGASLEDLVQAGPMKLDEAVRLATEIAQALEAAHEKGVVHRDIKAANVMLTAKGAVKVLDFGLAKITQATILTRLGSTVGTAAYMSPEQTRGAGVDHRTDLWSLGVLLYEMIAGRRPFGGDYEQAISYSILNEEAEPLTGLRTGVPMGLEWIVTKLLAKEAADRYQSASDLIVDLRTVDLEAAGLSRLSQTVSVPAQSASKSARILPAYAWAGVGALAVALLWVLWPGSNTDKATAGTPKHIVQPVPVASDVRGVTISAQGDKVALVGDAVQVLDLKTDAMRTYDVAGAVVHVDFSADGAELLLTKSAGIERMSLATGSVVNVVNTRESGPRAAWRNEDFVVYEERQTIYGVSITTSEVRQLITRDSLHGEYDLDFPYVLPDGKTLVATAEFRDAPSQIGFWDLDSGRSLGYLPFPGYRVHWVSAGYLVFSMDGDAMALPFDLETRRQTGPLLPIARFVPPQGLSISQEGTLVHVGFDIGVTGLTTPVLPVVFRQVNSSGDYVLRPDLFPSALYAHGAVSPDGKAAAVSIRTFDESSDTWMSDLWILDFATGARRALTQGGTSDYPAWSPEGDSIYFITDDVNDEVRVMAASGRGGARTVPTAPATTQADLAVSPRGDWAVTTIAIASNLGVDTQSSLYLWELRPTENSASLPFRSAGGARFIKRDTPNGNPRQFDFSPSGRYLAFEDQGAIFVLPMDDLTGTPYLVWENSMSLPRWAADESRLYAWGASSILFVDVQTDPAFSTRSASADVFSMSRSRLLTPNLFDVFPNTDYFQFLAATADPTSRDEAASDSLVQSVDLHFIINLPALLAE